MKGNIIRDILFSLILSFLFITIFSTSTSPLFSHPFLSDSGIFQLIGMGWIKGQIPYQDLWDNKGPLLYLINSIGYLITGNRYGVFILQIINMTVTLYIVFRIFKLKYSHHTSLLCTIIALLWLSNTNVDNNPAEWLLIPESLSFYFLYRWLYDNPRNNLSGVACMVCGLTIGCGFMLRLSDCLPLVISLLFITVFLIYDKRWNEVLRYGGFFIIGFAIIILPFVIYFQGKGALQEMWYATFTHNLEYVAHSGFQSYSLYSMGSFLISNGVYIGLIITSLLIIICHLPSRRYSLIWFIVSCATLGFVFQTYARSTYGVSSWPLFCILVFQIDEILHFVPRSFSKICWGLLGTMIVFAFTYQAKQALTDEHSTDLAFYQSVEEKIPPVERNSFIGYDVFPDIYYYTSLRPVHRFFITYAGCIGEGDSLIPKIRKEYQEKKAKWILVRHTKNPLFIKDILQRHYRVEARSRLMGYTLFKKVE